MSCPLPVVLPVDPVPLFSNGNINFKAHDVGWIVCSFFVLVAIATSTWLINKHLSFFYRPPEQIYIVRILLMIPVYSLSSFLSYFFYNQALYFTLFRDFYEAIVISSFFSLLLSYLAAPEVATSKDATPQERTERLLLVFKTVKVDKWIFPFGSVKWRCDGGGGNEGTSFFWLMRLGIAQYVVLRPLSTLAAVISEALNGYCVQSWSPKYLHIYCIIIVSISVSIAMYCVLQLWQPIKPLLAPYHPLLKFISVKSVVFLSFWQDTLLGTLVVFGVIKGTEYWTSAEVVVGFSAMLESVEMMFFAFLHIRAFSYYPYLYRAPLIHEDSESLVASPSSQEQAIAALAHQDRQRTNRWNAMCRVMDYRDVFSELFAVSKNVVRGGKVVIDRRDDLEAVGGKRMEVKTRGDEPIDEVEKEEKRALLEMKELKQSSRRATLEVRDDDRSRGGPRGAPGARGSRPFLFEEY